MIYHIQNRIENIHVVIGKKIMKLQNVDAI